LVPFARSANHLIAGLDANHGGKLPLRKIMSKTVFLQFDHDLAYSLRGPSLGVYDIFWSM